MKLSPFAGKMCVTVDVQEHNTCHFKENELYFSQFFFLQEFAIMVILNIAEFIKIKRKMSRERL